MMKTLTQPPESELSPFHQTRVEHKKALFDLPFPCLITFAVTFVVHLCMLLTKLDAFLLLAHSLNDKNIMDDESVAGETTPKNDKKKDCAPSCIKPIHKKRKLKYIVCGTPFKKERSFCIKNLGHVGSCSPP